MIEVVLLDVDGAELIHLGRRYHDRPAPEVLIDGCAYTFFRYRSLGVVEYRRRKTPLTLAESRPSRVVARPLAKGSRTRRLRIVSGGVS